MARLNYSRVMGIAFEKPAYKGDFSFTHLINTDLPMAKTLLRLEETSYNPDRKSYASIFTFRFSSSFLCIYEEGEEEKYGVISSLDLLLGHLGVNGTKVKHTTAFYQYLYGVNDSYQYLTDNPWLYKHKELQRLNIAKYRTDIISILESFENFTKYFSLEGEWGGDILIKFKTKNIPTINSLNIIPLREYKRRFAYDKFDWRN